MKETPRVLSTLKSVLELLLPQLDSAPCITAELIERMRQTRIAYILDADKLASALRAARLNDDQLIGLRVIYARFEVDLGVVDDEHQLAIETHRVY